MPELKSHFEMSRYLEDKGYDIFPFKIENGKFKVSLWIWDRFIDYGRFEYLDWEEAVRKTTRDIYNKLIKDKSRSKNMNTKKQLTYQ